MVAKFTLLTLLLTKFPWQRNLICQETRRSAAAACSADSYDHNAWPVKLATHYGHIFKMADAGRSSIAQNDVKKVPNLSMKCHSALK